MTAPRAFRALLRHDIVMMLRSVYLMYLLLPLAAGLLLRAWLAGGDDDRLGVAFTLLLTVLFAIAMAGTLPGLYLLVEERERGSCQTLARTGVSPASMMWSKLAAGVAWSMALSAVALAMLSPFDATCTVMLWLSCLPAAVAIAGAATAFGGVIASGHLDAFAGDRDLADVRHAGADGSLPADGVRIPAGEPLCGYGYGHGRRPIAAAGMAARCGDQPDMAHGLPDAVPLVSAAFPHRRAVSCPGRVA